MGLRYQAEFDTLQVNGKGRSAVREIPANTQRAERLRKKTELVLVHPVGPALAFSSTRRACMSQRLSRLVTDRLSDGSGGA